MDSMKILGVRIDNLSKKEILQKIEFFLSDGKFHQIATVNPEFILHAQKDQDFKNILNKCDLNVADGIGIKYAFMRHFKWLRIRISGAELLDEILQIANKKKLSLYLALDKNGLSNIEEIKTALAKKYPDLAIFGKEIEKEEFEQLVIDHDMVFCNFGAPYQEKFINLQKNDTISLAMGVGGAFDFLTGKISRAPKFARTMGFEWLWRLIQEPKYRAKRIFNAVIIFPLKIIFQNNE